MAISGKLVKINDEIVTQEDLLIQILESLQNKSAPNLPTRETWVFALADGSTIEKEVYIDLPKGNIIKVSDSSGVVLWENLDYIEIGTLGIGSRVSLNVNGTARNFIIVQQGNPDATLYDSSCNGTWLLMEDIYTKDIVWDSVENDYANSDMHAWLNSTFLGLLDPNIRGMVKTVKIPYTNGIGNVGIVQTGASGLSTQIFLLSVIETNGALYAPWQDTTVEDSVYNIEGCVLDYFIDSEDYDRIAYYEGVADTWYYRSPGRSGKYYVGAASSTGGYFNYGYVTGEHGIFGTRPAFVLPSNMRIVKDSIVSI